MKKFLLSLFGLACLGTASADTYMHVDYNGKTDSYNADDVVEVTFEEEGPQGVSGTYEGYEYVDLGLKSGLMWATCSVGANKPEECGNFYAWGHTEPLEHYIEFSYSEYKFFKNLEGTENYYYTKYVREEDNEMAYGGKADNLVNLLLEDDAASVNLGGNWRMPTEDEMDELMDGCTWQRVEDFQGTGVFGLLGTSTVNGNTIFFPYVTPCYGNGDTHLYWSSSLSPYSANAYGIGVVNNKRNEFNGMGSPRLEAGSVRAVFPGTALKTKIYMLVHLVNGSIVKYDLDDVEDVRFEPDSEEDHEYVDLDLPSGTKWATCNVGATKPEEYGSYFGWGETEGSAYHNVDKSKWNKFSNDSLKSLGVVNDEGILSSEFDAATQNWGEKWRMPTKSELSELMNYCNWKWTTLEGVNGYKISSKKNSSKWIFLPATFGYSAFDKEGGYAGIYWSSTVNESNVLYSSFLRFEEYRKYTNGCYRASCHSVRPVLK